ncbi:hypothetical protein PARPLA_00485 [Rhodobacteraceae bacterium THAF1]|uniref:hypothetical protein n=1 Tax=Palleronia sp. THAF1 TaxID=2587842 RepID=UPI000F3CD433|nr:hypothetical protein [Palleronia sp. THAF1]QFU09952.1 hypothetical protein FIU81_14835 [Palleronia sp. THAF1]VDC17144.1 hypothetical protein PARPLA_00485 [Rhodobacteraceae bacterium THAF1]
MIDLSQKARSGRTRALSLSRHSKDNVFFETPDRPTERRHRTRSKIDKLFDVTPPEPLQLAS